jgi:hypothetical protein
MPEHTDTFKLYKFPILIKQKFIEKEDSIDASNDYEHPES